jgi:hypothetical protein
MEYFVGFMLCLFIEALLWGAYRMQQRMLPPLPPVPQLSPGQEANHAAYEADVAVTPRVVGLRLRRRTRRGGNRKE